MAAAYRELRRQVRTVNVDLLRHVAPSAELFCGAWPSPLSIWEEQPVKAPQLVSGEGRHYVGGKQVQRAHALLARQGPPGKRTNYIVAAT